MHKVSKQADKSELEVLGTAVHDLKLPLASIKSFGDLIKQTGDLNDKQAHYLDRIQLAVENMTNLINDLLELVWIEEGMQMNWGLCNLADIIANQISAHQATAKERGVAINLKVPDHIPPLEGDERRLRQLFGNLISNGIKYNNPGGRMDIAITPTEDSLQIDIRDQGIGIAEKDLPHIFERFYRAPRRSAERIEGSGLGLSIVQGVVERHHGQIAVTSKLEEGTTFRITLPLKQHTSASAS
jgi:signal transduction histidine kinase